MLSLSKGSKGFFCYRLRLSGNAFTVVIILFFIMLFLFRI